MIFIDIVIVFHIVTNYYVIQEGKSLFKII